MAVVPEGGPEGVVETDLGARQPEKAALGEKRTDIETSSDRPGSPDYDDAKTIYVPDDGDEVIDPRLKDYPVPLVAKTVSLHNDFSEPILTFRFFFLATFWVVVGDAISSMYYCECPGGV
jgi:hypothetical protein